MKLLNLFKLEYNSKSIVILILIAIISGLFSTYLFLSNPFPNAAECMSCPIFLYYIPTLPAVPAIKIIDSLPLETWQIGKFSGNYVNTILDSFSILKLVPIYLIFFNTFLFGLLLTLIPIKIKNIDIKSRIKHASVKYLIYFFIWIIIFSIYVLVKYPVAPFVTDDKIVSSCRIKNKCLEHFIHYRVPNCDNIVKLFVFPFKIDLPKKDNCLLNNFIQKNPFKNMVVSQHRNVGFTTDYGSSMDRIINYFKENLESVHSDKKLQFCETFSSQGESDIYDVYTEKRNDGSTTTYIYPYTRGSNKDMCMIKLGLSQEHKDLISNNKK